MNYKPHKAQCFDDQPHIQKHTCTHTHTQSALEAGSRTVLQGTADNDIHWFNYSMDLCLQGQPGLIRLYGLTVFSLLANSRWPSRHQVTVSCDSSYYFHGWTEVHEQCWASVVIYVFYCQLVLIIPFKRPNQYFMIIYITGITGNMTQWRIKYFVFFNW